MKGQNICIIQISEYDQQNFLSIYSAYYILY